MSRSQSILTLFAIVVCGYFIQNVILPIFFAPIIGYPFSWLIVGAGTIAVWVLLFFLLMNIKRDAINKHEKKK